MGNIGDREDDYQEDKTVSIFGEAEEKTVAGQTPPVREEAKETAKAANGKSGGKGLTAIVGAAVAIVGIAAITLWQGEPGSGGGYTGAGRGGADGRGTEIGSGRG